MSLAATTTPEAGTVLTGTATTTPEAGMSLAGTTTPEAGTALTGTTTSTPEAGMTLAGTTTPEAAATITGTATPAALGTPSSVTGSASSGAIAQIPGVNTVTYNATEYAFQGPATFAGGWTQLVLNNQGKEAHDLQLYKLEQGKTISDVITALAGQGQPDWAMAYGGITVAPGKTGSFIVQIPAGTYVILSFGNNQSGPPDAARGMLNQITVTAPQTTAQPTLPTPAATVDMVDFHFVITGTINSGDQLLRFINTGTENHEAAIMKLKPGKTMADVQKALQAQAAGTPTAPGDLPVDMFNSIQLAPGATAYTSYNFAPGDYVFICFIPSAKNGGKPHFELGMIQQVTVK